MLAVAGELDETERSSAPDHLGCELDLPERAGRGERGSDREVAAG